MKYAGKIGTAEFTVKICKRGPGLYEWVLKFSDRSFLCNRSFDLEEQAGGDAVGFLTSVGAVFEDVKE